MEITIHPKKAKKDKEGTANSLYKTCTTLRGFIASWVKEKRCPLPLVDYFLEHDMVSQAECARWCATQPMRRVFNAPTKLSYPYPARSGDVNDPWWFYRVDDGMFTMASEDIDADDMPRSHISKWVEAKTRKQCILNLLDAWNL